MRSTLSCWCFLAAISKLFLHYTSTTMRNGFQCPTRVRFDSYSTSCPGSARLKYGLWFGEVRWSSMQLVFDHRKEDIHVKPILRLLKQVSGTFMPMKVRDPTAIATTFLAFTSFNRNLHCDPIVAYSDGILLEVFLRSFAFQITKCVQTGIYNEGQLSSGWCERRDKRWLPWHADLQVRKTSTLSFFCLPLTLPVPNCLTSFTKQDLV